MCSLCKRIYAYDSIWLELEEGIRRLDVFDSPKAPDLDYTVCPVCIEQARSSPDGAAAA